MCSPFFRLRSRQVQKVSIVIGIILCLFSSAFAYSGGSGEPNDPYRIATVSDWQQLMNTSSHWGKYFIMTADVNLQGVTLRPVGNSANKFTGIFNSNGHIIRNVVMNRDASDYVGLFGYISSSCQINNLGVVNVNITGRNYVGGLVGCSNYESTITNCYATGAVDGEDSVGGLVGKNYIMGAIADCYATGAVTGNGRVGGLVGHNFIGIVTNCYATGAVSGEYGNAGGLVGRNEIGAITDCYATGAVSGNYVVVGGLVGSNFNRGIISDCYATGAVTGNVMVGGLVGWNVAGGSISSCYSTGSVSGSSNSLYVGGLVGVSEFGSSIVNCYSTGAVDGNDFVGGLVGYNYDNITNASFWDVDTSGQATSAGGVGKTTAEMKTLSTFTSAGWDFAGEIANGLNDYWQMEASNYPRLTLYTWTLEGEGTFANPYVVANAADLGKVWLRPLACYRLAGNLDLTGISWSSAVVPVFAGSFDGQRFVISHLTINQPGFDYIGLFGRVNTSSQIRNISEEDVNITGRYYVGGLVGENVGGTITDCYTTGAINGYDKVGGLVGFNNEGSITACYATSSVSGTHPSVGGLVGINWDSIRNCYSTGLVSGDSSVGGLCGESDSGSVVSSFWDVNTSGRSTSYGGTGKTTAEMKTRSTFISAGWDFVGETANGTKDIWTICEGVNYPKFVWQNQPPIAEAGEDQTVYAWIDGVAEVDLDGLGSSDADCNELTYYWSWVIDGNTYEANGVNPTIELPVGVHTIQLIVNDGLADSVPDDVNITVAAPLKSALRITPRIINRCSRQSYILALVRMPGGIMKKDISNEPLILYPGEIEASRQWIVSIPYGFGRNKKWLTEIFAFFDKDAVVDAIPINGWVELKVAGELTCGRYFYGSDTVIIIGPRRPWHFPKK